MEDKAGEAEHPRARQTGDPIAQDLDRLWTELNDEEIGLVDFLLSVAGTETFIANYDEPIFKSLVEKGLLQLPRDVGENWLRAARTSFRVTPAVRDRIRMDAIRYFGEDDSLLTTPPCSENVIWSVFSQPVQASPAQIAQFAGLFNMNARPLQRMHHRLLLKSGRVSG